MIKRIKHICAVFLAFAAAYSGFGRDVYISSSTGDDKNDGSISAPLRTIAATPKDGAKVYLKRGDVFFETLQGFENSEIDSIRAKIKTVKSMGFLKSLAGTLGADPFVL